MTTPRSARPHAERRTLRESLSRGGDSRTVAQAIVGIARARSPKLRYAVGAEARWLPYLKVLLPQRLTDVLVRRGFGLRKNMATASAGADHYVRPHSAR